MTKDFEKLIFLIIFTNVNRSQLFSNDKRKDDLIVCDEDFSAEELFSENENNYGDNDDDEVDLDINNNLD